jgi:hypothetical protein
MPLNEWRENGVHGPGSYVVDTDLLAPTCGSFVGGCTQRYCNPDSRYYNRFHGLCDDQQPDEDDSFLSDDEDDDENAVQDMFPEYNPEDQPPEGRRMLRVGVELEGGWDMERGDLRARVGNRGQVKTDGSVSSDLVDEDGGGFVGEFCSRPYKTIESLVSTVGLAYPSSVDDSCGLHIHTSWTPGDYSRLAEDDFAPYFRDKMEEYVAGLPSSRAKRALFARLKGDNTYCRVNLEGDGAKGVDPAQGVDRYRQINYAWERHKTIECRLLPMFDQASTAVNAIKYVLGIYESFLAEHETPAMELDVVDDAVLPDVIAESLYDEVDVDGSYDVMVDTAAHEPLPAGSLVVMRGWNQDTLNYTLRAAANARIQDIARTLV